MADHIQTGMKEPVEVMVLDQAQQPLTGLTNVKVRVRRVSDGYFLDWVDDTFKTGAAVTQILQALSEVNATYAPGKYFLNNASHVGGFDPSVLTNHVDDDTYMFTALQDGSPSTAGNLPHVGELRVGGYLDRIDAGISDAATPTEVYDQLVALRLHHLVKTNPGALAPGTGTYIKQIIDEIQERPTHMVLQCFSYEQVADRLEGMVWVEYNNLVLNSGDLDACTVRWYDKSGSLLFTMTDAAPDAQGFYKVEKDGPGLSADKLYYAVSEITITGVGTISGGKGSFTF